MTFWWPGWERSLKFLASPFCAVVSGQLAQGQLKMSDWDCSPVGSEGLGAGIPGHFAPQVKAKESSSVYCRKLYFLLQLKGPARLNILVGPEDNRKITLVYIVCKVTGYFSSFWESPQSQHRGVLKRAACPGPVHTICKNSLSPALPHCFYLHCGHGVHVWLLCSHLPSSFPDRFPGSIYPQVFPFSRMGGSHVPHS